MKYVIVGMLCLIVGAGVGFTSRHVMADIAPSGPTSTGNGRVVYGENGPKNCRAIIKESVEGYFRKDYTADEALFSLDRNCGEFGYSWDEGERTNRTQCLAVLRRWGKEPELAGMCRGLPD